MPIFTSAKCISTWVWSNLYLPWGLEQAAEQEQGSLRSSSWHAIPPCTQEQESGRQGPRQSHPQFGLLLHTLSCLSCSPSLPSTSTPACLSSCFLPLEPTLWRPLVPSSPRELFREVGREVSVLESMVEEWEAVEVLEEVEAVEVLEVSGGATLASLRLPGAVGRLLHSSCTMTGTMDSLVELLVPFLIVFLAFGGGGGGHRLLASSKEGRRRE